MAPKRKVTFTITPGTKPSARANTLSALRKAAACLERGELEPAWQIGHDILRAQPQHFDALHLLGVIAARQQRPAEAIELISRALVLKPDAAAYANRGAARHALKHHAKALADCDHAIALKPDLAIAHCIRGHALKGLQRPEEAFAAYDRAVELDPGQTEAWYHRGNASLGLGKMHNALASYDRVLELQPAHANAHANRGVALSALRRHREALDAYDQAIALQPGHADAYGNRGNALSELGRQQDALASFERAVAINPKHVDGRWNQSLCHLLAGNFKAGWAAYDSRWQKWAAEFVATPDSPDHLLTPENFGKPVWDGTAGKTTILVWPEQGIGDQILFASMLPDLQSRVGSVMLALDERLHPLFARSFPRCTVTTLDAARKEGRFDAQIPLGNLGRHFRNTGKEFLQHRKAYLKADRTRSASLRKQIAPAGRRICGIAWHSTHAKVGADKSMRLADLRPLLEMPGLRCVDLQYGDTAAERAAFSRKNGIDLVHLDAVDNLRDIDGVAALIDACDVIVTISNTTAHIAGALGKEVWLMLPHNTGRFWYWQTGRDDTLWYPNVHVVRQPVAGDWGTVVERVCATLTTAPAPRTTLSSQNKPAPAKK
jgi:tetratricopeptide (TPR) repeat protein